jgi:hypothetical protein
MSGGAAFQGFLSGPVSVREALKVSIRMSEHENLRRERGREWCVCAGVKQGRRKKKKEEERRRKKKKEEERRRKKKEEEERRYKQK